jgi:hypothetical protein
MFYPVYGKQFTLLIGKLTEITNSLKHANSDIRKDQTIQFDDHRMTYGWLILTLVESFINT